MNKKLKKTEIFFIFYYVLFLTSLFIEDISFKNFNSKTLILIMKAFVALLLIFVALIRTWKKDFFFRFLIGVIIGIILLLFSGDFFWLIVILMGFVSSNVDEKLFFKVSFYTILILCIMVILGFIVGLLPDVITYRTDFSIENRHSFGFIHSSILSLCIFYLMIYYINFRENERKNIVLLLFLLINITLYKFCGSKNAFFATIILSITVFALKKEKIRKHSDTIIHFVSKHAILIFSIISFLPGYLRYKGLLMDIWYRFDLLFTNRSLLAASAINAYGVHVLNRIKYSDYMSTLVDVDSYRWNGIVLDNGYLYILVRYGIIVLILLWFIFRALYYYKNDSILDCAIIIILALVNMTDNDLLSYGFLPFMLLGIRNLWDKNIGKEKKYLKFKGVWRSGRIN